MSGKSIGKGVPITGNFKSLQEYFSDLPKMSEINFDLKYFQNKYGDIISGDCLKKIKFRRFYRYCIRLVNSAKV